MNKFLSIFLVTLAVAATTTSGANVCREAVDAFYSLSVAAQGDISMAIHGDFNAGYDDLVVKALDFIQSLARSYSHNEAHQVDLEPLAKLHRHGENLEGAPYIQCIINEVLKDVPEEQQGQI